MSPRDFCYWLRGYMELQEAQCAEKRILADGWDMIMDHLDKVFSYETNPIAKGFVDVQEKKRLCGLKHVSKENDPNNSPLSYLFFTNVASC